MRIDRRELAAIFAGGAIGALATRLAGPALRAADAAGRGPPSRSTSPARSRSGTSPPACRSGCRIRPTADRCSAPASAAPTRRSQRCRSRSCRSSTRTATASRPATPSASIAAGYLAIWLATALVRRTRVVDDALALARVRRARRPRRDRTLPARRDRSAIAPDATSRSARSRSTSAARSLLGLLTGLGARRRPLRARRHRDARLLHDLLDLDARDPPAGRGRRARARRCQRLAQPRCSASAPPRSDARSERTYERRLPQAHHLLRRARPHRRTGCSPTSCSTSTAATGCRPASCCAEPRASAACTTCTPTGCSRSPKTCRSSRSPSTPRADRGRCSSRSCRSSAAA